MAELNKDTLARGGHELIGESHCMLRLKKELNLVAASPFSVLIQGETGVGKELVARDLHLRSSRAEEPLVYVNCAALPENLIESELFGHVKGAFTGADKDRAGKFALADGGTLFLDEIGELPLAAQSKLLRALQSNEIQPVGQDEIQHVDVRVLAATNRDLASEVSEGRFRADLYHRLSVYPVQIPPLRQRHGDIGLLAGYFIEQSRRKLGVQQLKMADDVIDFLNAYAWPGNVRELEHVISRAALKASANYNSHSIVKIEIQHCGELLAEIDAPPVKAKEMKPSDQAGATQIDSSLSLKLATAEFQRQRIRQALSQHEGNWSAAARELQTDRANLARLSRRLGVGVSKQIF